MYMLIIEIDPTLQRAMGKRRVHFAEDGELHEIYYEIDTVLARGEFKHGIPTATEANLYRADTEPGSNYVWLQTYTAPRTREAAYREYHLTHYKPEQPMVIDIKPADPELERLLDEEDEIVRRTKAGHAIAPPVEGVFYHKCKTEGCPVEIPYDDEPYCFTHSPDEGSSVKGYSAYQEALDNYVV